MAALLSVSRHYSTAPRSSFSSHRRPPRREILGFRCSSSSPVRRDIGGEERKRAFDLKKCALSVALAFELVVGVPQFGWPAYATPTGPVLPDLSVLISGPPIKDPGALLRNALPIDNKAIREVQKPLEDITDSLKIAGVKALDSVERNRMSGRLLVRSVREENLFWLVWLSQRKPMERNC